MRKSPQAIVVPHVFARPRKRGRLPAPPLFSYLTVARDAPSTTLRRFGAVPRQPHGEGRAASERRVDRDRSAVGADDLANDEQPEPNAGSLARSPLERLEHPIQ